MMKEIVYNVALIVMNVTTQIHVKLVKQVLFWNNRYAY